MKSSLRLCLLKRSRIISCAALLMLLAGAICSCRSEAGEPRIKALSEDTFLFLRSNVGAKEKHLYAYDMETRKARLVTDFEGAGVISDMGLSSDRRWVAFSSLTFRINPSNNPSSRSKVLNYHLWKVSVDGRHFVRLSRSDVPLEGDCPDFVNSYGPHPQTCTRERTDPVFSPDGDQVFFSLFYAQNIIGNIPCANNADCPGMSECYGKIRCSGIRMRGGSSLYRVESRGGAEEDLPLKSGCRFETDPVFNHAGNQMLLSLSFCSGRQFKAGIHVMKAPFDRQTTQFLVNDHVEGDTIVWRPDDSGFLYCSGKNLKEYNFAYKSSAIRFQYRRGTIEGFSPNADHSRMVIALKPKLKKVASLYLMDMDTGKLERLTSGFDDTRPCWHP